MTYVAIKGFSPDQESTTEGILQDTNNFCPTQRGMEAIAKAETTNQPVLSATVVGAVSIRQVNGTIRTFAGTPNDIFEDAGGSWTNVSSATGSYTLTTRWRFEQLEDETFATNDADVIQFSASGAFSDLTGAPTAAIIQVIDRQLVALNTNDGTFGDDGNRWRTAAQDDPHDWTIAISVLGASGRLVDTPGEITAGRRLGDQLAVYKEDSLYLGRFVGPPEVLIFDLRSDEIGASNQEAVVSVESFNFFASESAEDFFVFDGSTPVRIGHPFISEWFFSQLDRDSRTRIIGVDDVPNERIFWWYPSTDGNGAIDRWVCFHYKSNKWGKGELTLQYVFDYIQDTAPTYDTLGDFFSTYEDLPTIPYDDKFWTASTRLIGLFDTTNLLRTLSGGGQDSSMTLFDIGTESNFTFLSRARPRFRTKPLTGTLDISFRENLGDDPISSTAAATLSDGKFDFERSSRWHTLRPQYTGTVEVLGYDIEGQPDGEE